MPQVLSGFWTGSQGDCIRLALQDKAASTPDLELIGHEDDAEFALGMCSAEPLVASGGKDKNVSTQY